MTDPTPRVADLAIGLGFDFSDADAQLAKYKQHVERETGIKLSFDNREALSATDRVKRDLEALGEVNKKQVASQVQASRFLGAQYELNRKAVQEQNAAVIAGSRQDQAAAQARTAQLREQAAQLSLNTRLAAKQRQDERDATRQTLGGIENQVKAYRDLWQARVLSNDQVYAQQGRLRDQALSLLLTVDKQSDAYRRLTAVAAAAQRSQDASQGLNTPGGFGAGISQGITNALGQFGLTGDLIAGFIQMFSAKRAAAATEASNLGRDTMAGLVAGMKNNQGQVKEVANRAGDSVAEAIRVSLDIHSPSRVTEYLGKMAGLGFVTGMKSYQGEAAAAARALSGAAQGGLRNTSVSGGVFGGSTGNFDAGNLAASATALAALNQQLMAAQSAGEGAAEGSDVAAVAADGLGESVGGAAEQVKTLRDAHNDQDAASRRAALNEAQTAIAFTVTAAAVTAVAVALVASYNTAADYQKAMSGAKATTEATAEQLALLDAVARSPQFVQLGVGAKAAAAGIEELGSQGLSTADIMDGGLLVSLTLAKAVNTDVAKAAAVAASSTKAFGLEAKDLARIGDITTNAVNGTSIKMENFSDAIAAGGDQAKRSGLNFTEFTAGISFLTDKAIGASDAGTSLKSFLMALTPNTKDAANEMKRLGFNAFDSQGNFKSLGEIAENLRRSFSKLSPEQAAVSAEMIFGSDGARVYGALVEQGNKGVQERITLLDRQGTMEEAARQKMEGARGAQEKLNAALENFKITAGSMLLGPAAKLLDWATNFLTKIDAVNQELAKVKDPGDIRATLKIDWAKDDATTVAYKLLVGGVEGTKNIIGQGIAQFSQTGFMQNIQRLDALQLQTQLQQAGVLAMPRNGDSVAATRQFDDVRNNMPKYQQLLAEALIRNTAAMEKATAAGTQSLQGQLARDLVTGRPLAAVVPSPVDGGVLSGSGPLLPGQARPGDPKKATGLWTQEFISSLKDTFVSDPKIDSDCAIIASRILQAIGVKIEGSPIAATLAKEIKGRGGTQKVSQAEAQVGDYIDFAGPGFGLTSGHHSGVVVGRDKYGNLRYINNHGYGSRPGVDVPTTIDTFDPKYVAKRGTATFYRVAESPYAQGGRGVSDTPAAAAKSFEDYRKEASRILAQIAKFAPDGTAPDGPKWRLATAQLETFGKQNAVAADAVKYAQLQMGMAGKEVSRYGQTFDRLKGQLNLTDSLDKLGENVLPQLRAIQSEAQKAASTELARNGRTEKYRELLGLAGDAASKLKSIEGRKPDLTPLQQEQQRRAEQIKQEDMLLKMRGKSAQQLQDIIKGGVVKEGDLDRIVAAQKEVDRREELGEKRRKEAQGKAAQVNEAIRQNDIASAKASLSELERLRDTGLQKVKGNAASELAIQKQYADLVYNAKKAVLDKEKKDRDADITSSDLPQGVKDVQLGLSLTTYKNALAEVDADRAQRLDTARATNADFERQAAKAARELRYADADATLARMKESNRQALADFKGTVVERLALIRQQSQAEFDAAELVARVKRDNALRDNDANTSQTQANHEESARQIGQQYTDAVAVLKNVRLGVLRTAQQDFNSAMQEVIDQGQSVQDAYGSGLIPGANGFQTSGTGDTTALYKLADERQVLDEVQATFAGLGDSAAESAGIIDRDLIPKIERLIEKTDDPQLKAAGQTYLAFLKTAKSELSDLATQQSEAWDGRVAEVQEVSDAYGELGDTSTQLSVLQGVLSDLFVAMDDGENVAAQIDKVTAAIDRLLKKTEGDDVFNGFVAQLSGTVDEQIMQVADRLASETDVKVKLRLQTLLGTLRQQMPSFGDPYAAGYIPRPDGTGFTNQATGDGGAVLNAIALRDRLKGSDGEALTQAVIDAGKLLASSAGEALPERLRTGLQEAVSDAQGYLAGLGEEALTDLLGRIGDAPEFTELRKQLHAAYTQVVETRQQVEATLGDIYNNPDQYSDGPSRLATTPDRFTPTDGFEAPEITEQDVGYLTQMADVFERFRNGDLTDPDGVEAFTSSLRLLKDQGKLTAFELQALLDTITDLTSGDGVGNSKPLNLTEWQEQLTTLTDDFDSGVSTAEEYAAGLQQLGVDLEGAARAADKAGNPTFAKALRDQATQLRAVNPEVVKLLAQLGRVQDYAGYVRDVAGAFGQLAGAIGEGEQEYDSFTGKKLQTPWKDLAANLEGVQNAAGKVVEIAGDVMAIATNPANVGAWVKLLTTIVSSIADAVAGFQKAQAEVRRLKEEFAQDNPFLNAGDYQKVFTRSRGFFADLFGGGPEVVNEIDKVGLKFAQTMQGAFQSGIKNGLTEAIRNNDFSLFSDKLHEEVYSGLLDGVVDVFLNETLLKNIIAPAIKAWSDALKTPGTADDAEALAGIDVAVGIVDDQAARFYNDVAPRLQGLQDKWGLTPEETKGVDTTGLSTAPPAIQYALSTPLLEGVQGIKEAADILKEGATLIRDTFKDGIPVTVTTPAAAYQSGTGAIIGR